MGGGEFHGHSPERSPPRTSSVHCRARLRRDREGCNCWLALAARKTPTAPTARLRPSPSPPLSLSPSLFPGNAQKTAMARQKRQEALKKAGAGERGREWRGSRNPDGGRARAVLGALPFPFQPSVLWMAATDVPPPPPSALFLAPPPHLHMLAHALTRALSPYIPLSRFPGQSQRVRADHHLPGLPVDVCVHLLPGLPDRPLLQQARQADIRALLPGVHGLSAPL